MDISDKVLIVGGGIGGMATAIRLRQQGTAVDLIDIDPEWRVYGAGITITVPTLRAFHQLGLLDRIRAEGAVSNGTRLMHFSGAAIADFDEPTLIDGKPALGGILRPALHAILSDEVRAHGANVRLGVTVESLRQNGESVDIRFTDGTEGRYALVVAADGIYSKLRSALFPAAVQPSYTGQGSWRILATRPEGMDKAEIYVGHANPAGIVPCSPTQVYLFCLNTDPARLWIEPEEQPARLRALLAEFGGQVARIRDTIGPHSSLVYRPLESAIQPKSWHSGRVVLLGDAAHATTPHLASGAGAAVEDALVLSEELARHGTDVPTALAAYTERRFDRCRFLVEASVALGAAQMAHRPGHEIAQVMDSAMHRLAEDI